jgi:putative acetyltransferase
VLPLCEDPCFTFRFAEARIIPRFPLEGVEVWRRVSVFKIDPTTGERLGLLTKAAVGGGGWVDLPVPVIVKAGDAFIAVPGPAQER